MRWTVRMTRRAISPRLATSTDSNTLRLLRIGGPHCGLRRRASENLPVRPCLAEADRHEESGRDLAEALGWRLDPPGDDMGQGLDDARVVFVGHAEPKPFERICIGVDGGLGADQVVVRTRRLDDAAFERE